MGTALLRLKYIEVKEGERLEKLYKNYILEYILGDKETRKVRWL